VSNRTAAEKRAAEIKTCCKCDERTDNRKYRLRDLTALLALIGAIGSLSAAGFAGWQAWIARDSEVVSNRALVISNSMRFVSYQDPSKPDREWQIWPVTENVGNTPTRSLRFFSSLGICAGKPPTEDNIAQAFSKVPESAYERSLIGPKSDINGITLTASSIQVHCPIALIAYGFVKYSDMFGYPHITEFCDFMLSIDRFKDFPAGSPVRLESVPCQHHNCADDECGADWKTLAIN
jgi:hypothetical protein